MRLLFICSAPRPLPIGAARILEEIWRTETPDCVFFGGGYATEELAARLSVRVGVPCCAGAIGVQRTEDGFTVTRRLYGGELVADYHIGVPCLIVLDREYDMDSINLSDTLRNVELEHQPESWYDEFSTEPDDSAGALKSAARIIVVGRGIKNKALFQEVSELANRLGAAVGATRPAVYNGWAPLSTQIGISGISVKPEVCLIIAASGSQAFLSAIDKNTRIIAVNDDPDAPVFYRADWGVVGDAGEIVRELLKITGDWEDPGV